MSIMDYLYPRRCPICDEPTGGRYICAKCKTIPRIVLEPRCVKCGKHIDDDALEYCLDCRTSEKHFVTGISLYEYDSVSDSIYRFKNKGRSEYADFYTEEMVKRLGKTIKSYKADALIPIPLHKSKEKKRGYNQSEVLALGLSKKLGIPVRNDVLIRTNKTKEQKKLSHGERQNNLVGAFHMTENDVKLESAILIDDVYTTGSTMDEAARTLLAGGVKKVFFVTLAIGIGNT